MKFGLTNVDGDFHEVVEINTIKELIKLQKKYDEYLILRPNLDFEYEQVANDGMLQEYAECEFVLEVYDDYRE